MSDDRFNGHCEALRAQYNAGIRYPVYTELDLEYLLRAVG